MTTITNIFKAPLLHFALLGALLFVLYAWINPESMERNDRIIISKGKVNHIANRYAKKWKKQPTGEELKALIDDYVLTEIYYLEGVKLGFDKNDVEIKRRVRQKIEMISNDILSALDVKDEELEVYLSDHPEKYTKDAMYSIKQVYINANKHSDLDAYLLSVKELLTNTDTATSDSTMMQDRYDNASSYSIDREFGKDFSKKLDRLTVGQWSDVLKSGLGLHFVKLEAHNPSKLATLDEVRDIVLRDYLYEKRKEMMENQRQQMLKKYEVDIYTDTTTPKADVK